MYKALPFLFFLKDDNEKLCFNEIRWLESCVASYLINANNLDYIVLQPFYQKIYYWESEFVQILISNNLNFCK